jgi:hypothetical protein
MRVRVRVRVRVTARVRVWVRVRVRFEVLMSQKEACVSSNTNFEFVHHLCNTWDVVVRGTNKAEQTFHRILSHDSQSFEIRQ